jgi:hypothetical protein
LLQDHLQLTNSRKSYTTSQLLSFPLWLFWIE